MGQSGETLTRQGPGLGGPDLVYCYDFNQIPRFARLPTARSVHRAKALRSCLERAIAQATTKSFFESEVAVDLQLKKTAAFLELQLDAQRRVKRMSDLSGLVLSRCALRDYRFDCAALGHVFAAQHRLCLVVRRLPASCCPCLMRARCTPQAVLAACCSAWLRRSFRHNPRLRIGRQGEYHQHTTGRVPERIWIARR